MLFSCSFVLLLCSFHAVLFFINVFMLFFVLNLLNLTDSWISSLETEVLDVDKEVADKVF